MTNPPVLADGLIKRLSFQHLDSNSELSEIPRTKARKKASRGSVQRLTAEQLTCHALGMADPTPTPIVAHSSTGRPLPLLSDSDDSD